MRDETLLADVSDTAFWVCHYRARETERPDALFRDRFAKVLAGKRGEQISNSMSPASRYAEWTVVSRTVIIDRFIQQLVREGIDAVINLGAGLDARPYRMKLPEELEWVEVDFPNILAHKLAVLGQESPVCKLTRVAVDLSSGPARRDFLASVVPHAKKVVILTEGVIPYLSSDQVSELASDLRAQERFTHWIVEYFHPRVYRYLRSAVRELKMVNTPFRFYPADWYGFFGSWGWTPRETRFGGEIAVEFNRRLPMPKWARWVMPFVPKRVREEALRTTGHMVFERTSGSG